MNEEFIVLVEEILISETAILKMLSEIGFPNVVIVTTDDPAWDSFYGMARITNFHGIPTPIDNRFALVLSKEHSENLEFEGMSYGKRRGFTIVVRENDTVEDVMLKFKYDFLRRLNMPADAITYYYTVESENKSEMLKYAILCHGCKLFKHKFYEKYYNLLFKMYANVEKPTWKNSSKVNWE